MPYLVYCVNGYTHITYKYKEIIIKKDKDKKIDYLLKLKINFSNLFLLLQNDMYLIVPLFQ